MPSGKVHDIIWKGGLKFVVLGYVVLIPYSLLTHKYEPLGFIFGYLLGSFIEPDLDQLAITKSEGRLLNWFKDIGAIIVGYFNWYAFRFKHRGISHYPVVGTFTRWAWIFMPFIIVWIFYERWSNFNLFLNEWFWWIFIGNCFSDLLHVGADFGWKIIKIFYKKGKK